MSVLPPSTHGGNLRKLAERAGCAPEEILDFSANLNPLGPPEWLRPVISSHVASLAHYPDPENQELISAVAERYGVSAAEVVVGNGSTEILYLLPRLLQKRRAIIPVPAYVDYARAAAQAGMEVESVVLRAEKQFQLDPDALAKLLVGDEVVLVGRPGNPTGAVPDANRLRELARRFPKTVFIIDEAFGDFVEGFESLTKDRPDNVVVLLSLTKNFAIPGLRLGAAVMSSELAASVRAFLPPWTVNTLAQAVGVAALRDTDYLVRTRAYVTEQRVSLAEGIARLGGFKVFPGEANFLVVRSDRPGWTAQRLADALLQDRIAVRICGNYEGLDERYLRIAVRTADENARFCEALSGIFFPKLPAISIPRSASTIMFQGTSSNAGKSVLTAALCRILHQDGYRVAPFKSQNMSLNSFVTRDGCEMGRAQVVQAQACRIEPDARMNPILLKPNSDTGSQVIVQGKPVGNMAVRDYIRYKPQAFEKAKESFDCLAAENDVVVLEGAGSPGEVNLKRHDIANMLMAQYAKSPVLLVGDIDRGGIYASFVGTMEVLSEWERQLIAGFVVNRFRGQKSLLQDAHDYTLRHTGKPVLGVVPYLKNLGLPEEDSVSFKAERSTEFATDKDLADIAVLDLPHISNFTDFDAFRIEPDVRLRIVRDMSELGEPDAILLPGSKNVITDLQHLRQSGLAEALIGLARSGKTEIVGVCGGYQMLGRRIEDPHRIESNGDPANGLELLDLVTVMAPEKTLRRVQCSHTESGCSLVGYEIHHGRTVAGLSLAPCVVREDGEVIGTGINGRVWGTYLHGVFDADLFRRFFIDRLRQRKGLAPAGRVLAVYDLQTALDRLADVVRESLDMKAIYKLLRLP